MIGSFIATYMHSYHGTQPSTHSLRGGPYESKADAVKVAKEIHAGIKQYGAYYKECDPSGCVLEVIGTFHDERHSQEILEFVEANTNSIIVRDRSPKAPEYYNTLICVPVECSPLTGLQSIDLELLEKDVTGYHNLHGKFGWPCTVHRAPANYQHPWIAVGQNYSIGCWSREEAREWRRKMAEYERPQRAAAAS